MAAMVLFKCRLLSGVPVMVSGQVPGEVAACRVLSFAEPGNLHLVGRCRTLLRCNAHIPTCGDVVVSGAGMNTCDLGHSSDLSCSGCAQHVQSSNKEGQDTQCVLRIGVFLLSHMVTNLNSTPCTTPTQKLAHAVCDKHSTSPCPKNTVYCPCSVRTSQVVHPRS